MGKLAPSYIVGIGGSAGGHQAYMALLDSLPATTGMAFVIISHMHPDASNQLASLLSRHTTMPVDVASSGMTILANHVYVIPPNADLRMDGHAFQIVSPRLGRNNQVDIFLTCLATTVGARAIGIVLSGYDGDGAEGCKQIKAKGGTTFAQDWSAEIGAMPHTAQATGCVDFVLPPDKIAAKLQSMTRAKKRGS